MEQRSNDNGIYSRKPLKDETVFISNGCSVMQRKYERPDTDSKDHEGRRRGR